MKNSMVDVRNHLIAQLEKLSDATAEELAQEIDRAKAIGALGAVLIDSAKTEIQWMRDIDGAATTGFLPEQSTLNRPRRIA